MMGYTFAIAAIIVFAALFFVFKAFERGGREDSADREDYRKGSTYKEPLAEEPQPPPGREQGAKRAS